MYIRTTRMDEILFGSEMTVAELAAELAGGQSLEGPDGLCTMGGSPDPGCPRCGCSRGVCAAFGGHEIESD